jgi:hypothetical protein
MSSGFHRYTREEFLGEFSPESADKAEIAAGTEQLRAEQRAFRLAEVCRRLGVTQAEVAERMGVPRAASRRSSAPAGATEGRTLAAHVEALGGRLEIIAVSFGLPNLGRLHSCLMPRPRKPGVLGSE